MNITIVAVGKIKEKYLTDAIREYSKRLSRYCKLDIVELQDEQTPDKVGETTESLIKQKEGLRILRTIKEDSYVIGLAVEVAHGQCVPEPAARGDQLYISLLHR